MIAANLIHPITPSVIKYLNLPSFMFGIAYATMSLTNFIFSPVWSYLTKVMGKIRVFAIGCLGYGGGQFLFMLAGDATSLIVARIISGIFAGSFMVAAMAYVSEYSKDNFKTNMGIFTAAGAIATSIGFFIGGQIGSNNFRYSFYLQFILLVIIAILITLLLKNDISQKLEWKSLINSFNPFKNFGAKSLKNSTKYCLFFIFFLYMAMIIYDNSFNYYLRDILALSASVNGNIKAISGIMIFIFNASISVYLVRKFNLKKLYLIFTNLTSLVLIVAFLFQGTIFYALNVLFYLLIAVDLLFFQTIILNNDKENSTNLSGLLNSLRAISGFIGATVAGFIYGIHYLSPFGLIVILLSLSCFMYQLKLKE